MEWLYWDKGEKWHVCMCARDCGDRVFRVSGKVQYGQNEVCVLRRSLVDLVQLVPSHEDVQLLPVMERSRHVVYVCVCVTLNST